MAKSRVIPARFQAELMPNKPSISDLEEIGNSCKKAKIKLKGLNLEGILHTDKIVTDLERSTAITAVGQILKNSSLQSLNLDNNFFSNSEAEVLAKALEKNQLQKLSLKHCLFENVKGLLAVLDAVIKKHRIKIYLDFAIELKKEVGNALLQRYKKYWDKLHFSPNMREFFENLKIEREKVFRQNTSILPDIFTSSNPALKYAKLPTVKEEEELHLPEIKPFRHPKVAFNPFD